MPCLKPAQPLSPRSRSALVSNLRSSSHPTMLSCSREILKQFSRKLLSSASSAHSQRKIQRSESEYFASSKKILTFPQTLVLTAPLCVSQRLSEGLLGVAGELVVSSKRVYCLLISGPAMHKSRRSRGTKTAKRASLPWRRLSGC